MKIEEVKTDKCHYKTLRIHDDEIPSGVYDMKVNQYLDNISQTGFWCCRSLNTRPYREWLINVTTTEQEIVDTLLKFGCSLDLMPSGEILNYLKDKEEK